MAGSLLSLRKFQPGDVVRVAVAVVVEVLAGRAAERTDQVIDDLAVPEGDDQILRGDRAVDVRPVDPRVLRVVLDVEDAVAVAVIRRARGSVGALGKRQLSLVQISAVGELGPGGRVMPVDAALHIGEDLVRAARREASPGLVDRHPGGAGRVARKRRALGDEREQEPLFAVDAQGRVGLGGVIARIVGLALPAPLAARVRHRGDDEAPEQHGRDGLGPEPPRQRAHRDRDHPSGVPPAGAGAIEATIPDRFSRRAAWPASRGGRRMPHPVSTHMGLRASPTTDTPAVVLDVTNASSKR